MITIYTMAWNEEILLQFMIDHYRFRFPDCKIIIRDNESTDNTLSIAKNNNCVIINYLTDDQVDDAKLTILKNTCWKDAATDWVLVCDVDELLDINEQDLKKEQMLGSTMIKSKGYHMINMEDNLDINSIKYGTRAELHDKSYLFNKKFITDINYSPGAHYSNPAGSIKFSDNEYLLYHYKFINLNYTINRYAASANRLSEINKKNGWGWHNTKSSEEIIKEWKFWKDKAILLK